MKTKSLHKNTSRKIIPEQVTFSHNSPIYIPLFLADKTAKVQSVWELELENGERDSGKVKRNCVQLARLPLGRHTLTLIVGQPILVKGTKVYQSIINIID